MAVNFVLLLVIYMLTRWAFFWMNAGMFPEVNAADLVRMSLGGVRFDVSALCYLNMLFIVMQFLPARWRERAAYQRWVKVLFLVVNIAGVAANVADIVYFEFGGRRTTALIFAEYGGEGNLLTILFGSIRLYWQAWLFGAAMIAALVMLYCSPVRGGRRILSPRAYYVLHTALFVVAVTLAVGGARGGYGLKMHPMRQQDANAYCRRPVEAAIVLNTPFTIITTAHQTGYRDYHFFDAAQLDSVFSPIHNVAAADSGDMRRMNVVVFQLESFSMEYTGFFNSGRDGGTYAGYTPFLDSLLAVSHSFRWGFANGMRSVDCMPATFAGIPRYLEPYSYYFYSNNTLQGLAEMLGAEGYATAFFHGAPNTTLSFHPLANAMGFDRYYGMDEYAHPEDFDGTWAIFDEPYLQYFAGKCCEAASAGKPFLHAVFTASSHEPFTIPEQHRARFTRGDIPMHRSISYADYALRRYFDAVSGEPWLANTLFVFTADHCGVNYRDDYNNEMGRMLIPIFFYTPGGQLPAVCDSTRLIQQTDITPTVLGLLNYRKPYFSFGKDVFAPDSTFVNYVFNDRNGTSMYYLDDLMIEYADGRLIGIYEYQKDFSLRHNLISERDRFPWLPFMQRQMEATLQQYVERMKRDDLRYPPQR